MKNIQRKIGRSIHQSDMTGLRPISFWRRWLLFLCALVLTASFVRDAVAADTFPSKTIRIVVGYVPGGAPDVVARAIALQLQKTLLQPVIVDNRPGAGGVLATQVVARSAPDGYTLLLGETGQLVIAPFSQRNLPYDPVKDLTPIALVASTPLALVSSAKWAEVKNFDDFRRETLKNSIEINYGSSGNGTIHHVATEVMAAGMRLRMAHIPYKGSGASIPALLGGEIPVVMTSLTAALPLIQSQKINLLAVTSPKRFPGKPDTPAISEFLPGYDYRSEIGLLAPAQLPAGILRTLSTALKEAMSSEDVISSLAAQSIEANWTTPAAYGENISQNLVKYRTAFKVANIPPQ